MDPKNSFESLPEVFVSSTELSRAVSRAVEEGSLRQIGPRVYTRNLRDPAELLIRRHLWQVISALLPGALIADRTALELRPSADGSIFVVADRKRDLELPGVIVRPRRGPPPLMGMDGPFIGGLFVSSEARAYLDNMVPSRTRAERVRRTMTRGELETRLDDKIRSHGREGLNQLRDQARQIAPQLGRESEFLEFDRLASSLLGTHEARLESLRGRARQAGTPYDPARLELFAALQHELRSVAPVTRFARERGPGGDATLAFFEAYFSNFIEGTKFSVAEASKIVFENIIPRARPEDAHDVAETWRVVSDRVEMARRPTTPAALLRLLKARHATVMAARPDKHPGAFKQTPNQAGSTVFVAPDLVEGTLIHGFELYHGLDTAFARAAYLMFLVAEVHPFTDGNGRIARIMMNAELAAADEERILIPTVLRDNYISELKALSHRGDPRPFVRVLDFMQRWVAAVPWTDLSGTTAVLTRCHAFLEPAEAEEQGVRLRMPDPLDATEEGR